MTHAASVSVKELSDQWWRLTNLYYIVDKSGRRVRFDPNWAQANLFQEMHYFNVILKARQLGFSTFIDLFILDTTLFNANIAAGVIAHSLEDANAIFRSKIKFPYDNLPEAIRLLNPADTDRVNEIRFKNGSGVRVATSMRSATVQILHVSEYGKIAVRFPDRAIEIKTGAFEAVGKGSMIFVESTAEGRDGEFYKLVTDARKLQDLNRPLTELEFKFHFYPWWKEPNYTLDPQTVVLTEQELAYFVKLNDEHGITLTAAQMAWYAAKSRTLGEYIKAEHPSTPDEAFEASTEGAYYARQLAILRQKGRIGAVPYEPLLPVNTFWDLGMNDAMAIWFHQRYGTENRLIDYVEASGEGFPYFANVLAKKGYVYGMHYMPHDAGVRDLSAGGLSRLEIAKGLGIRPIIKVDRPKNADHLNAQIELTRNFLAACRIDESKCAAGLKHLENYRKEWDEKLGTFKLKPLHNAASHGADALRTGAAGFKQEQEIDPDHLVPEHTFDF